MEPTTAKIAVDGVVSGNPYDNIVHKDNRRHKVDISADGYNILTKDLFFDKDRNLTFKLEKLPDEAEKEPTRLPKEHQRQRVNRSSKHRKRNEVKNPPDAIQDESASPTSSSPSPLAPQTPPPADTGTETIKKRRQIDLKDPW